VECVCGGAGELGRVCCSCEILWAALGAPGLSVALATGEIDCVGEAAVLAGWLVVIWVVGVDELAMLNAVCEAAGYK